MALKDTWVNKVDGVDISSANDINEVAQAVIDLENESGYRPDFAANEGEKGFIKNRTHYIDKDGKVHALPIEFIPEGVAKEKYVDDSLKALFVPRRLSEMVSDKYHRTVEDDEKAKWNDGIIERWEITENYTASSNIVIAQQSLSIGMWKNRQGDIELGIPYAVYINGTEYFCIAGKDDGTIYLGNPTLFYGASEQPHKNEPFCITWAGGNATAGMFFNDSTLSYPLTLKVTGAAVTTEKKLPKSYLPDDVALKSDIPEGGGGGGADIDVIAEVGQTIVVEEVDADGKPTKWKAAEYQERICNTEVKLIYPEQNCVFSDDFRALIAQGDTSLTVGNTYIVNYNGVDYTEKCVSVSAPNGVFVGLGNFDAFLGTGDNGVPFVIIDGSVMGMSGVVGVAPIDGSESITLSIKVKTFTQIPQDFLANVLPYYIDYTTEIVNAQLVYHCDETLSNITSVINSGRLILARLIEESGYLMLNLVAKTVLPTDASLLLAFCSVGVDTVAGDAANRVFMRFYQDGTTKFAGRYADIIA